MRGALRASPFLLSAALLIWSLNQSPFTRPFVEAAPAQIERSLQRAMARQVSPDWLAAELGHALEARDLDRIETLVLVAEDHGLSPLPEQQKEIEALRADSSGFWATTQNCALCMADIESCPSLALMGSCSIPFELTPLGDANALRRAGLAVWEGEPVDKLDVSLALVGLGATTAVVVTGGSSVTVKAGATVLRLARRMGTLTPSFMRTLARLSDITLRGDLILPYMRGSVPASRVVDTARLNGLGEVATDLSRVAANTSLTDTVRLMRHVDDATDARRLARVSEVTGPRTAAVFDVLGKQRVFRALVRLSDAAIAAAALIYLTLLQIFLYIAGRAGLSLYRVAIRKLPR